jgi:hypothetical protein
MVGEGTATDYCEGRRGAVREWTRRRDREGRCCPATGVGRVAGGARWGELCGNVGAASQKKQDPFATSPPFSLVSCVSHATMDAAVVAPPDGRVRVAVRVRP